MTDKRYQEAQLDLCVATLAQVSPAARDLLWERVGQLPPPSARVWVQDARADDGRPSDVVLVADGGGCIHVENKVNGGSFGPGQLESYRVERSRPGTWTLLVAPQRFLDGAEATSAAADAAFSSTLSVTDLAAAAHSATGSPETDELCRRWAGWLEELDQQPGYVPDEHHQRAWVDWYRALVAERSHERVRIDAGSMKMGQAAFARFETGRPAKLPYELTHKLLFGVLDLRVPRWVQSTLETHLASSEHRLPTGWYVARQAGARKTKLTGQPAPVLRHDLGAITFPFPPTDECTEIIEEMIDAADTIRRWLQDGGHALLENGPSHGLLDRHLRAALDTARTLQQTHTIEALEDLLDR